MKSLSSLNRLRTEVYRLAAIAGLILLASQARAAFVADQKRSASYFFEAVGADEGLTGTTALTALQTRDGYLWVGTESGLARFEGLHFDVFRASNVAAFTSNLVNCLLEDRAGTLWIGTERGLVRYAGGHFERIGLTDVPITALAEDHSGTIWIGTRTDGLYTLDHARPRREGQPADLPSPAIGSLLVDSSNRLWIGFSHFPGLVCRENAHFHSYNGNGRIHSEVISLCESEPGTIWIGTRTQYLFRLRGDELTAYGLDQGVKMPRVTDLHRARDGGVLVSDGYAQKIGREGHEQVTTLSGAPTNNVWAMCDDTEGGIWLCAAGEGLFRAAKRRYPLIGMAEGLPGVGIKTVSEDPNGNIWLAIQRQGVSRVGQDGSVKSAVAGLGIPGNNPTLVYAARDGSVWTAAENSLSVWRNGKVQAFPEMKLVRGVFQDREGTMWIGCEEQGLFKFKDGHFEEVHGPDGRRILHASSFSESPAQGLAIGTWDSGVYLITAKGIKSFDHTTTLPSDDIRAVHIDKEGRIWVGMRAGGLAVLDGDRWYTTTDLSDAVAGFVSAIDEDDLGNLWVGGPLGVMWAAKSELFAAARGDQAALHLRSLGSVDGTHPAAVWSGSQPVMWKEPDGSFLFGTRWGVLAVDPHHIETNHIPPPVEIRSVTIDRQTVANFRSEVKIPVGAKSLAIDYMALSFVRPHEVQFQYKLDGYDRDWIEAGTRRTAYYTNLPSGRYEFRVKASNSDGIWNEIGAQLAVIQEPHFYESWWFFSLIGLTVVATGWAANSWSHRRLKVKLERFEERYAMERERRRIAKDLHDELGASLTELGLFAERARRKTASAQAHDELGFLSQRVRRLAEALDAVVWTVNPANDSLDRFASYIAGLFQDLFRLTDVRTRLDIAGEIPNFPLAPETRSHLFLATKEAMNNIIKHSEATEVWLRIRMEGVDFRFELEDNGKGFDVALAEYSDRNGLKNIRSRIASVGGTLSIESTRGSGTKVSFSLHFAGTKASPQIVHQSIPGPKPTLP